MLPVSWVTARRPYFYSQANSFINNLKKSPKTRGTAQWNHKLNAISEAARALLRELPKEWLKESTFVPIPPSKAEGHPEYDDRLLRILKKLDVDARELVRQKKSMEATHVSTDRHTVSELNANYEINEDLAKPAPTHIVVLDDMVTAGSHFRAICRKLSARFPGVPISGVFLARRIFPDVSK
jgi:predicted amidophosphoribosyltransferase